MAQAKKCDRCGKFYIFKNEIVDRSGSLRGDPMENRINITLGGVSFDKEVRFLKFGPTSDTLDQPDLCYDCLVSFCDWFKKGEKHE